MKPPRQCLQCKQWFCKEDARQLYCSRECSHESQRNRVDVTCAFCGTVKNTTMSKAQASKSGLHFCNTTCQFNRRYFDETGYVLNDDLRNLVADLMVEGWMHKDIRAYLGLSLSTITRIRKEYIENKKRDIDD